MPRMVRFDVCTTTPPWSPVAQQGGRGDVGVVGLVVVARGDQDVSRRAAPRSPRPGSCEYCPAMAVVGADEQHGRRAAARRARRQHRSGQEGGAQGAQPALPRSSFVPWSLRYGSIGQRRPTAVLTPTGEPTPPPAPLPGEGCGSVDEGARSGRDRRRHEPPRVSARDPPPAPRPAAAGSRPRAAPGTRAGPAASPRRSSAAPGRPRSRRGRCWPGR